MEDYMKSTIYYKDASSMFRREIKKNMKPYDAKVIKLNNDMVDDWEESVLKKLSNNGKVICDDVWLSWQIYRDGKWLLNHIDSIDMIPQITETQLEYWKDLFLNLDIVEMHNIGVLKINSGWFIINKAIRDWVTKERWERIYSISEDPYVWYQESLKHKDLIQGNSLPFWDKNILEEISEKVNTILKNQIIPS